MGNVLIYSTGYHQEQASLIDTPIDAKFRVGFKYQPLYYRAMELLSCIIQLAVRFTQSRIYIPRSSAKDNWIVYAIFKRRCILISDGLSDCLETLPVVSNRWLELGFIDPVENLFNVTQRSFEKRQIQFSHNGPIAIYNKRGRDPDYVSDYVYKCHANQIIVNPLIGQFSRIYAAPSTVLFELPDEVKAHVTIVSQSHCLSLDVMRRRILASYENSLAGLGFRVI